MVSFFSSVGLKPLTAVYCVINAFLMLIVFEMLDCISFWINVLKYISNNQCKGTNALFIRNGQCKQVIIVR